MSPNAMLSHSAASSAVRSWKARETLDAFGYPMEDEGETHSLRFDGEGFLIQVSFTCLPKHPEHVRIRSTNWRAEYEPSGIYSKTDCREFYAKLLALGFVKVDDVISDAGPKLWGDGGGAKS